MSDYYLGELRIFSSASTQFVPTGWLPCDGQVLQISQYQALYSLLGKQFGGDGITTFALPDLRGRIAVGQGTPGSTAFPSVGFSGGEDSVTLTGTQVPVHSHVVNASTAEDSGAPAPNNNYIGPVLPGPATPGVNIYAPVPQQGVQWTALSTQTMDPAGGGFPHENRQPVLALRIYIATSGLYPTHAY